MSFVKVLPFILGVSSVFAQTTAPPPVAPSPAATPPPAASTVPLVDKHFPYPSGVPFKADTDDGPRGIQVGYNLCNSTTENQQSLCQTSIVNSIDDFCVWGGSAPDSLIGNIEAGTIAWCTKPGHGARTIPPGALTAVHFVKTPDYVQITGLIKQSLVNIATDDSGGELDPHGADQRGNPLGGLEYSTAFSGNNNIFDQISEWNYFIGGNVFCMKACTAKGPHAADYCQHIYDRLGCSFNMPGSYTDGIFESCVGDSMDIPGVFTGADGKVSTYFQPPESLGPITALPYTPRVPSSSNCQTFSSQALYASAASLLGTSTSATTSATRTGASSAPGATGSPSTNSRTATSSGASPTTTASRPNSAQKHAAQAAISLVSALVAFAVLV
ncbi:hypothetical protein BU17DRAFT_76372 [Hysterangium stoloniferum]|nr:hypothetical protein BU17DRAFT_76372 [Hysterangium stoloniferum]